jgi:hypothetical protein
LETWRKKRFLIDFAMRRKGAPGRVTRRVCEKSSQNAAQTIFLSKVIQYLYHEKSSPLLWATPAIFKLLTEVNNHPMSENSPNLVTLPQVKFATSGCDAVLGAFAQSRPFQFQSDAFSRRCCRGRCCKPSELHSVHIKYPARSTCKTGIATNP